MSEADACAVLELAPDADSGGVSEEALKGAYRRLARRWHPDRNPAGRERFQAVQAAYERLQAGAAAGTGPQPWRLLLLLRARGPGLNLVSCVGATNDIVLSNISAA